jgi:glycosyltransferase involved in cell wall biosynthesis
VRVVYVVSVPGAGPVTHLLTLAPAVARHGVDVKVLCAGEDVARSFRDLGVGAVSLPLRHKLDLAGAARLLPRLRDADVVHTHDRRSGLLARPLARLQGARVVHTYHGLPHEIAHRVGRPDAPLPPGVSPARAWWLTHGYLRIEAALARLGTVVVPSRAVAGFLAEHRVGRRGLRVIANGIDVRRTEPGPVREPLVVGTAGILEHRKGIDVLIDACSRVGRPLRLELFGDGSLRSELERRAVSLGVEAVFHGQVDGVRERLPELDVFVLSSRDENLPIALLEAMAAALPVVATRVGGVAELVEDGVSGLLVRPDDVDGIATALEALASDEALRERVARAGARRVADDFSDEAMARRMVELYEELSPSPAVAVGSAVR